VLASLGSLATLHVPYTFWMSRKESTNAVTAVKQKDRFAHCAMEPSRRSGADGNIDPAAYERGSQRLDAEIADVEGSVREAMPETDGVEEVLAFAADVLPRSAEFWRVLPADQKVRFQDVIFPDGVVFDGQKFGTATMCYGFRHLPVTADGKTEVASPTGFEPL
jgi:hypothetical protein